MLVQRAIARAGASVQDPPADFGQFYATNYVTVLSAVSAFTSDRDLAAEATQEAFARALARWHRLADKPWIRGWVVTTATNHCKRVARQRQRSVGAATAETSGVTSPHLDERLDLVRALR